MVFGLVAVNALEVQSSHVHIQIFRGEVQAGVEIAMFDAVAPSAIEVAASAVRAGG